MRTYIFKVIIEEDPFEDGRMAYFASVPALPGCHTWAYTKEELLKNIQEAVQVYIESLIAHGEPVPTEGIVQVSPEPLVAVTVRLSDELNVDLAPDGTIYGIELLNANEQLRSTDGGKLLVINDATGQQVEVALT